MPRCFCLVIAACLCVVGVYGSQHPIEVITSDMSAKDPKYKNGLQEAICTKILEAKKNVRIFNYSSEDDIFVHTLNHVAASGIDVGCVFDRDHLPKPGLYNPAIRIFTRLHGEGHYHHKIFLIDDKKLFTGTANIAGIGAWPNISIYTESHKLAEPVRQEWDFYAHGIERTQFQSEDHIEGQHIGLYMMPHVATGPKSHKEQLANEIALKSFLDAIHNSKRKIVTSIVVWTMKDIARAIVKARLERGVDVVCHGASIAPEVYQILALAGIPVIRHDIIHHKSMLIDDSVFINGAANWSISAFTRGDEDISILRNTNHIQNHAFYEAVSSLY